MSRICISNICSHNEIMLAHTNRLSACEGTNYRGPDLTAADRGHGRPPSTPLHMPFYSFLNVEYPFG